MQRSVGAFILRIAPKLMKTLSIVGTAAMFLVGGGIIVHSVPALAHLLHVVEAIAGGAGFAPSLLSVLGAVTFNGLVGVAVGGILVGVYSFAKRFLPKRQSA